MFTNSLQITQFTKGRDVIVEINAYHVTIRDKTSREVLFSRNGFPLPDNWLDDKHKAITQAITALENAVLEAIT